MKCPRCSGPTKVPDSRAIEGGDAVARTRQCTSKRCGYSFMTDERAVLPAARPIRREALSSIEEEVRALQERLADLEAAAEGVSVPRNR